MKTFHAIRNYKPVYRYMWKHYGREWRVWVAFLIRIVSWTMRMTLQPIALASIIARLSQGDFDNLSSAVMYFAVVSVLSGIMSPIAAALGIAGESIAYKAVVRQYFTKMLSLDPEYFVNNMSGQLTAATRQFTDNTILLSRDWREDYVPMLCGLLLPLGVILWCDWVLGLIAISLTMIILMWLALISDKYEPYRVKAREIYNHISGFISDAITNIIAIKSCAQEEHLAEVLERDTKKEVKLFIERAIIKQKYSVGKELLVAVFFVTLLWVAVWRHQHGLIDLTTMVLAATYMLTIVQNIYLVPGAIEKHDDHIDKISDGLALLARTNKLQEPTEPVQLKRAKGAISLEAVDFAYDKCVVFKGVTLEIPDGQRLGVVGASGAGKSTLAHLVLRFSDPQSGLVKLDGNDLRDLAQSDLRRNIAYVPQEPLLLHDTVRANLMLAAPKATDDELWQALKKAHAADFVQELSEGLGTLVGERGIKLSGGQKQRIVIARALMQNAPVIIFDEATSALDSESEQIIKASFAEVLKGRTAIVIAHRLSTLADMDRIIVIDRGCIIEDGTHLALLRRNGLYAKMWRAQTQEKQF